ncbi:hypothetical protein [Spirosoma aerolatum]|uniref:hypothetical protein n=1 Tax=Spirosoma aerolatum TaxID=1211326 RepID=UPI0009ADA2B1|nr:hypothetical protein [Spirosoma aerolatum]
MNPSLPFLILLISLMACGSLAQSADSIRVVYSEEIASQPTSSNTKRIKALYNRFIRSQIEEKTLIKLGGMPTSFGATPDPIWSIRNEVAVEQKLTPAFSILISVRSYYRRLAKTLTEASVSGEVAGRWYFVMNRRIRQGKSANNFSGQYLTLHLIKPLWASNSLDPPASGLTHAWLGVGLGTQRRLSRFGYLDANIGPGYTIRSLNPMPVGIQASILIGFGL